MSESANSRNGLRRQMTLLDATMINIGSIIGSGIFMVPASVALYLQSPTLVITMWIVGGIVSLFGAISIGELGAMMPDAGGQYVYLSRTYGPVWGFLYGWACFAVINTASIAAIAIVFATYLGYFFPLDAMAIKLIACASVVLLTAINCFGVKTGTTLQNGVTVIKIAALALLAILGFVLGKGSVNAFSPILPSAPWSSMVGPAGMALVAVLFSYDGWIESTFVGSEIKDPGRNIPRSIIYSTLVVTAVYVLLNYSFIHVLTLSGVANSELVASDVAVKLLGPAGALLIAATVVISTFGANNGIIFTCPRIYYAMAKEGLFFSWMAHINPNYRTPIRALVAQAAIVIALIMSGTFNQLATYVVFGGWAFYGLSCAAVIVLRIREPQARRPYLAWGYPWIQLLFVAFSLFLVVNTIIESPQDALVGLVIIGLGLPLYAYWKRSA